MCGLGDLDVGAQVNDVGDPQLVDEAADRGVGQLLQVVRADQSARCDRPAVKRRHPADVAHIDDPFEVDPLDVVHDTDLTPPIRVARTALVV